MGLKLTEDKYDFDSFDPLEQGWYILKVKKAQAELKDGGLKAKVEGEVEQGPYAGRMHFENFSTRTNDGAENGIGCQSLLAFMLKTGIAKKGQFSDSAEFETEKFAVNLTKLAEGKMYGAYLTQEPYKDKAGNDKVATRAKKYRTVAEAQSEMGKGKATAATPVPDGKKAAAGNSSDWD